MADGDGRTAADREQARLAREARRERRAGITPASDPDPEPAPGSEPVTIPEPVSAAAPVPVVPPVVDPEPVTAPEPPNVPEPPIAPRPRAEPEAAAAGTALPLVQARDAPESARPIRSFPSPPDPEFYMADDELESPSGTRRVTRHAGPGATDRRPSRSSRRATGTSRQIPGPRARRPRRWLGRLVALILLAIAAAIVVAAIEIYQPVHSSSHGRVSVRIPVGSGVSAVGRILARDGVVSSAFFFQLRATLDGDRSRIRAGRYELARGMSYSVVLSRLTTVPKGARTSQLTLAEGHTRHYVAALLSREHIVGYLAATRHSALLNPRHYGAPRSTDTLEGFLFPDTFSLRDPIHVGALVSDQLQDFKRRFATVHLTEAHRLHESDFDIITIASLIEAESASTADDRRVASVIDNRLRDHMMLQLDSTARYATGNFTKPLTVTQLASKSPYNTHTHFGLPPGPINSPGLTALDAAAHPVSTPYLYFFSKPCSDQTVFATSYAQFQNLLLRDRRPHCPH